MAKNNHTKIESQLLELIENSSDNNFLKEALKIILEKSWNSRSKKRSKPLKVKGQKSVWAIGLELEDADSTQDLELSILKFQRSETAAISQALSNPINDLKKHF